MSGTELALFASALVASTVSGMLGMGGGSFLVAIMASLLPPTWVVPLHGLVQMTSNGARAFILVRNVCWWAFFLYVPTQLLGVLVARELYRSGGNEWLRPVIGGFLVFAVLWRHLKPERWMPPRWLFALGGFGGGLLTIFVGVTGPYLAAFFLRDDMQKEEIVATKAVIQMVGHAAKIPVFVSLGFPYREHFDLVLPLLVIAVGGTYLGTRVLRRMRGEHFRRAFEAVLLILALRLLADPLI